MPPESDFVVSVWMTTYFHEDYISQAIESVLSQKTSFPYEIIISDDCSTDGTQKIIREYAKKYDFIRYKKKNSFILQRNIKKG